MGFLRNILLAVFSLLIFTSTIWYAAPGVSQILEKLRVYNQHNHQQKVYVHFDRPLYAAGEDVWFNAYLVDADFNRPDSTSRIIYVELFGVDQKLLKRIILFSPRGIAHGDFHLADSLPQGNYLVRAYTNYMKNSDHDFFFSREITVLNQNDSLRNNISAISNVPELQFFPEGGNFIGSVENLVAFQSLNQWGQVMEVEGEIIDENNTTVTSFKSEHQGMGSFKMTPVFGKKYRARVKNSNTTLNLPEVTCKGYLMRVMETASTIKVIAYSDLKSFSDAPCRISIVAQSNGIASYGAEGEILKSSIVVNIPKSKLRSGITQITLFDGDGTPQCERLVFMNHQNVVDFSIDTNKPEYGKTQKVELDIHAMIDKTPVQGYFSLSVYDESKIQDPDKYPISINSYLLLTSDLKGRINDPGYYLKDTLETTKHHTNLLMLTHGWRRFTWKSILTDTLHQMNYYAEKGIVVSGKILKSITNRPAKNSEVKFMNTNHDFLILKTDSLGRFYNDYFLYYDSTEFYIQTDNAKGKQTDMVLKLDDFNPSPPMQIKPSAFVPWNATDFLSQAAIINKIRQGYKNEKDAIVLKEVQVKAKKTEATNTNKLYGTADATIMMKDMPQGYNNILQVLQGRAAGVNVNGNSISIRGGGEPLFLLDGMQIDMNTVMSLPINNIESIDILKGFSASIYGGRGGNGVIAVYTKRGGGYTRATIGVYNIKYPGLFRAREFYSPKHESSDEIGSIPDIRNTLYWNPSITTDQNGMAHVNFFAADAVSQYKIVIEGISEGGISGSASKSFIVE